MPEPRRILIVNPFGIGDVLFSTPLVRAVRLAFPQAHLAYLANRRTEAMLRHNPHLNELFIYEKDELLALWGRSRPLAVRTFFSLLGRIRRARFDTAIDLSLGERYALIMAALGVPRRLGFDFRGRGRFLTHRVRMDGFHGRHVVEFYADFLAAMGIRLQDRRMELLIPDASAAACREEVRARLRLGPGQRVVGMVPAGGVSWGVQASFRRWSRDGFIRVGQSLQRRYQARVVVFGEARDQEVCREITRAIGPEAVDVSGQTTLEEFVRLLRCCDVVIANDGGPVHLAVSQDVPTVSIFGPVDPQVYGPYPPSRRHQVVSREELPCRPCYHRFRLPPCPYERACLSRVDNADVLQACEALLG